MKRNKFWFVIAMLVMSSLLLVACDESLTDYHTHRYGAWEFTTTPTMDADGSATRSCECGDEQSVTVAKLSDASVWSIEISQEATHATNGYAVYKSTYGTVTTTSDKGQHVYGDWRITTAPTMDAVGSAIKVCDCGHSVTEEVPALSNNIWEKDESNKPSHDVAGSVIYTSDYGTVTIDVPAGTHSFGKWTANEDGTHSRSCDCGTTETFDHVFDQHVANSTTKKSDATCTTGAQYYSSCVCGAVSESDSDVFFVGEGTGHEFSEFTLTQNPTCTETGKASVKCEKCDYENDNSVIAALGHTWDENWHPYYDNDQYQDPDTGEVITEEDTTSSYHAHACTVCGLFDETNKVAHSYVNTYVTATKDANGTQMATEHACVCGYTEAVNDNLGYFEHTWTLVDEENDRKEPTYNEAGYEKRTYGDYEYTLVLPKLVAPYDGKTYHTVGLDLRDGETIGAASAYSWSSASVTLDENGKGTGTGYPFGGEHTVTMVDSSTGKITWKIGTDTYNGYVDMSNGIVVLSNANPFAKDVFVASWFEEGALNANAFAGSVWGEGTNMAISYKHNCAIDEHEFNIYVDEDGKVTFDVDFVDANGMAIGAGVVHQANYVKVLKDGVKLGAFAKDSNGDLIATDGLEGSYTVDLGNGDESVTLNGIGAFTTGTKSGTYTLVSDETYTADMYVVVDDANVAYYRITVTDGSMTAVKPMTTVNYETAHGTVADSYKSVNTNIEFTLPSFTGTITEEDGKEYVFMGWKLQGSTSDSYVAKYIPATTEVTFVATWAERPVTVTVVDAQGIDKDFVVGAGSIILNCDEMPAYTSDTVKNGYRFTDWYIDDNGNGIIDDEDGMVDTTTTATDNVTVIAGWEWAGNVTFEEQSGYTFVYDSVNGYWKSNNQGKNSSTATIEFKVASGIAVVSFDYYCESEAESQWDYMTINYGPDWKSVTAGGKACDWNWKTITTMLDSSIDDNNQRVRITYQKDSSGVGGSDTAYIRNLTVNGIPVAAQQPLNKDIAGTYTSGDTTVVVGAGGLVSIGEDSTVYTTVSDNVIGVTLADGYKEITLNKANGTCTVVVPQVDVTYNYSGHGDNSTTSVDKMTTQPLADAPTANGFKFRGWYTDAEFTTEAPASFVAANDVTFYAKWDKAVTITYVYNDGDTHPDTTDTTYYANDKVTSLQTVDFTYGDKVFVDWFTKDGTDGDWGDAYALNTVITDDITLYAKWVEPSPFRGTYTMLVFYNNATGAGSIWNTDSQKLVIDALGKGTVTAWNGFYNGSTVSIEFAEDSTSVVVIKAGTTTYYGVYDATSGVIVRSNTSAGFDSSVYMMVPYNAAYVQGDFEAFTWQEGSVYRKLISFADKNATTTTTRTIFIESTTNVVFGADWTAKKTNYTDVASLKDVKDNAIMLSVTAGSTTYYYAKNSSGSFVTATHADIQGKYTDSEDYIVINGADVIYLKDGTKGTYTVKTDGTITALTSSANYLITLNKTDNTFTKADNKVTITYVNDKITVPSEDVYVNIWCNLTTPTEVEGFIFRGWYTKDGTDGDWGTKAGRIKPTENVTYYAKYDAAVTITYHYNGYTDTDGNTSYTSTDKKYVNDTVGTTSDVLKDVMYGDKVFVGWFTKNGTDGDWGTEVTSSTTLTDVNTTFYAKWIVPHAMAGSYTYGANLDPSETSIASKNNTLSSSTYKFNIDPLGNVTGWKTGTIKDYDPQTGTFYIEQGSSKYYGGFNATTKTMYVNYPSNNESAYHDIGFTAGEINGAKPTDAYCVSWNKGITKLVRIKYNNNSYNYILIMDRIIYAITCWSAQDANNAAINDFTAINSTTNSISLTTESGTIFVFGKLSNDFVLSDGMSGTYNATDDNVLGSIVLDGYGNVTIGEATVSYDLDGTKVTFVHANRMYVLTLDKTALEYTQVQDGYQGTYTMPEDSAVSTVTLDGYGAITETTMTYVVNGTTVTIYDGETSTNYGIDTTEKKLLGKSIFAGLKFTKSSANYVEFNDGVDITGKFVCGNTGWYVTFTGEYDSTTGILTCKVISQVGTGAAIGSEFTFTVTDGKITFRTGSFPYVTENVSVDNEYTNADFVA